jgi:hypothetical protein
MGKLNSMAGRMLMLFALALLSLHQPPISGALADNAASKKTDCPKQTPFQPRKPFSNKPSSPTGSTGSGQEHTFQDKDTKSRESSKDVSAFDFSFGAFSKLVGKWIARPSDPDPSPIPSDDPCGAIPPRCETQKPCPAKP